MARGTRDVESAPDAVTLRTAPATRGSASCPTRSVKIALFDLDKTLLPIDSADIWSHFIVRAGGLDTEGYGERIREFAVSYGQGRFDVDAYLQFQMGLLARFALRDLKRWRAEFVSRHVLPHVRPEALALIDEHRGDGYTPVMLTGTNAFVARPIADAFGLEHLLAVEPESVDGRFTGRHLGTHTHQEGKVRAVAVFLGKMGLTLDQCEDSVFYSDSINDLPLLERVRRAVATNADDRLRAVAAQRGWPMLELFALAPR